MNHGRCATHVKYGLTCADFEAMRTRARDCCELCGKPGGDSREQRLHIDHRGELTPTCEVRGLLCSPCNTDLGRRESTLPRYSAVTMTEGHLAYLAEPFRARIDATPAIRRAVPTINNETAVPRIRIRDGVIAHKIAARKRDDATDDLYDVVRECVPTLSPTEIVQLTGWTREHVRQILRGKKIRRQVELTDWSREHIRQIVKDT